MKERLQELKREQQSEDSHTLETSLETAVTAQIAKDKARNKFTPMTLS